MMLRIFSSNYIVAAVTMMAIIHTNNGGVYAGPADSVVAAAETAATATSNAAETAATAIENAAETTATALGNAKNTTATAMSNAADTVAAALSKDTNESGSDSMASEDAAINAATTPEEVAAAQATATAELNNDVKVEVSSAAVLMSSMMGMAAVTTVFVAMA